MAALAGSADHCGEVDLLRRAGRDLRAEALRNHVEDAGVLQVVEERRVESGLQRGCLRIGADLLEVGGGKANARVAEIRAGVDPVLRTHGKGSESRKNEQDGKTKTQRKFHENAKPFLGDFSSDWETLRVSSSV